MDVPNLTPEKSVLILLLLRDKEFNGQSFQDRLFVTIFLDSET